MKRNIVAICAMVGALSLSAQWETDGNNSLDPVDNYVGNNDDVPLNFRTDSVWRMRLWDTDLTTLNSFPGIRRDGFVGISPVEAFYGNPGAFTRLHLVDSGAAAIVYAQDFGYRPWMRNGVTMTGNADQMYIGHKYTYVDSVDYTSGEVSDRSDAVIEWSDNPDDSPWGTDRMRFMFTNDYQVSSPETYGARSLEGMEAMRIYIPTDTTAHVGIGDFFRAGVINGQNEDPTERLHVVDGRVRIEQLPDDPQTDSAFKVMVVDDTNDPLERGVVKWVPASDLTGLTDCDWEVIGGDVVTAHEANGTNGTCPEEDNQVGIGTNNPSANTKLHVFTELHPDGVFVRNEAPVANAVGLRSEVTAGSANNAGVVTQVSGPGTSNIGVFSVASNSTGQNTGVSAWAAGGGTGSTGVNATASGGSTSNVALNATANSAGDDNTGLNARVSDGTDSNTGARFRVAGSAPVHHGASINVADGTTQNEGINLAATTSDIGAANAGVHMSCTTPEGSTHNRGVYVHLVGRTDRSRGIEVVDSSDANITAYGGQFNLYSSQAPYTYGVAAHVRSSNATGHSFGLNGQASGDAQHNIGTGGSASATTDYFLANKGYYGVFGQSTQENDERNVGVAGYVEQGSDTYPAISGWAGVAGAALPRDSATQFTAGTMGYVGVSDPTLNLGNFAVYGESEDTLSMWAGFFQGNVNTNGSLYLNEVFHASDAELKEDVQPIEPQTASEVIAELNPVTYAFTEAAMDNMGFLPGTHPGLIAQEVQEVVPQLVRSKTQPARIDTLGNIVSPAQPILTINYVGLIPYLIAANQSQQARLDAMEQQLAACCATNIDQRVVTPVGAAGTVVETDLRIIPNPVADQTELRYTLAEPGRVRLEITDQSGRVVLAKEEGQREASAYGYQWDTTSLSPGTYNCALYVNDEQVVRKAVKLAVR